MSTDNGGVTAVEAAATFKDKEISHAIIQILVESLETNQSEIRELIVDFNLRITTSKDEKAENKDHKTSDYVRVNRENIEDSDGGKDREVVLTSLISPDADHPGAGSFYLGDFI